MPPKLLYCQICKRPSETWIKLCPKCKRYNSYGTRGGGLIVNSTSVDLLVEVRNPSGVDVFDDCMAGGIVIPSCVLMAGIAGAGKSTMALQIGGGLARSGLRVAYVCKEEEPAAIATRARRVDAVHERLDLIRADDVEAALFAASTYDVAIFDSIQRLGVTAGMITGPKTKILISQLSKEGEIHGPRSNEHDPDALLFCEYDPMKEERILISTKNRGAETKKIPYILDATGVHARPAPKPRKRARNEEDFPR